MPWSTVRPRIVLCPTRHGSGVLVQICKNWSERLARVQLLKWPRILGVHEHDEVRTWSKECHLAFRIATISAMRAFANSPTRKAVERALNPLLPVSRLPLGMGNGHDDHCVRFIEVNDGKGETVKYEPPRSIQISRPALRRLGNVFKSIIDRLKEPDARFRTPLQVPIVGRFKFRPRLRINPIELTSRHSAAEPLSGGAPHRPQSIWSCRIGYHRPGV